MGQEEARHTMKHQICDKITKNHFDFKHIIGRGGYGKVWKVTYKRTGKHYALKEMSKAKIIDRKSVDSIIAEKELLSSLDFPFITNLWYSFHDSDNVYLLMNLFEGGNLRYHLNKRKRFTENQAKFIIACTWLGLEYTHSKGVIHRDIKPDNLVLDNNGYVYLTDFGIAKKFSWNNKKNSSGTLGYIAPEVWFAKNYNYSVDFYALGVMLYEFIYGHRPFMMKNKHELKEAIMTKRIHIKKNDLPFGWSEEVADWVNRLLERKPTKRWGNNSINEIKTHEWFKVIDWEELWNKKITAPLIPGIGENYDKKYCWKPEEIGEETLARYCIQSKKEEFAHQFACFECNEIPEELKFVPIANTKKSHSSYKRFSVDNNKNLFTLWEEKEKSYNDKYSTYLSKIIKHQTNVSKCLGKSNLSLCARKRILNSSISEKQTSANSDLNINANERSLPLIPNVNVNDNDNSISNKNKNKNSLPLNKSGSCVYLSVQKGHRLNGKENGILVRQKLTKKINKSNVHTSTIKQQIELKVNRSISQSRIFN